MELLSQPSNGSRIEYLDILRGIAILFIFIANIMAFSGFLYATEIKGIVPIELPTDLILDFTLFILVDGKFYSIFSLLFGIGFAIQLHNQEKAGKPFVPFFRRRMSWLLIIGLIHLIFIWFGDILTLYAICGFILILFRNHSNRSLLIWASILLILPIIHTFLLGQHGFNYPEYFYDLNAHYWERNNLPLIIWYNGEPTADLGLYVTTHSFSEYVTITLGNWLLRIGAILEEGRIFKVFGIFLIGVWAGRNIIYKDLLNNLILLRKILIWSLILGLPASALKTYIEFFQWGNESWNLIKQIAYLIGTVPLALSYASAIALLLKRKIVFLHWFQPVGKMALSNYLMQSIIGITIFYGVGLGLAGKLGFTLILLTAISIFIFQALISKWWLSRFQYGPAEWVWRRLSYGKNFNSLKPNKQ
ncbi:DUF418 domain-containing protein [Ekhidna sp.]